MISDRPGCRRAAGIRSPCATLKQVIEAIRLDVLCPVKKGFTLMPLILTSLLLCRAMVSLGTVMPATASASEAPRTVRFSEASSILGLRRPTRCDCLRDETSIWYPKGVSEFWDDSVVRDRDPADSAWTHRACISMRRNAS